MKKERKYLVLVKNLILKASVGIYQKEKTRKQKVRFNIFITATDNIKTKNDISDLVSYEDVIKNVKYVINRGHIPLIENLAQDIAKKCLINKKILKIEIMIEKLETFKEAESVGIKIVRMNRK
jgi:dihydroneopterin aldolase